MVEESIAGRIKLRRERIAEIEGEEKNIDNKLFNCLSPSQLFSEVQVIWTKKMRETEGTRNENRVYLVKEVLNKL